MRETLRPSTLEKSNGFFFWTWVYHHLSNYCNLYSSLVSDYLIYIKLIHHCRYCLWMGPGVPFESHTCTHHKYVIHEFIFYAPFHCHSILNLINLENSFIHWSVECCEPNFNQNRSYMCAQLFNVDNINTW